MKDLQGGIVHLPPAVEASALAQRAHRVGESVVQVVKEHLIPAVLPSEDYAMMSWRTGHVRAGSFARNLFHGCECVKFVMNIQAAEKPTRAKKETVSMNRQPWESGRPSGQVPSNQMQVHRDSTNAEWMQRRGSHFVQNSLLHLPPGPSSGKFRYHSQAKRAPVSLRPQKWITGTSGAVTQRPRGCMGKGFFPRRQVHSSIQYWKSSGSQPNSPCSRRSTVLAW